MADDSKVIIGVEADTKQADKEFDKLKKKMEQTSSNIKGKMGGASSGVSSNNASPNGGASSGGTNLQTPSSVEDPNNWGKTAGKLFTAEFISRMSKQGADVIRLALTDPSTGNDKAELVGKTIAGAIDGAIFGAMMGKAMMGNNGGATGMVVGSLVGSAFNALMSGVIARTEQYHRIIDEMNQEQLQQIGGRVGVHTAVSKGASQQAESMMSVEERRAFYKQQWDNLQSGDDGITKLSLRINDLRLSGEKDSLEYKRLSILRDSKLQMANEYEAKYAQESMRFSFKKYEADSLTDSFAKQGIQIGNQVNVADLQQRQLEAMDAMKSYLKTIAEKMGSMSLGGGNDSVENFLF